MIYMVDIDETICVTPDIRDELGFRDYTKATPIKENIAKVNQLYDEGHTIVYWTARGTNSGIDWNELVHDQLKEWGAKYHRASCGKPHYDVFICDKAINSEKFFNGEAKYSFEYGGGI